MMDRAEGGMFQLNMWITLNNYTPQVSLNTYTDFLYLKKEPETVILSLVKG